MRSRVQIGLLVSMICAWIILSAISCTFAPLAPTTTAAEENTKTVHTLPTSTRAAPPTATPAPQTTAPPAGSQRGDTAIDFTLTNLEGEQVTLSDLRGKVVLLNFWAAWCGYCRVEMPDLQQAYDDYQDQGLVVLGVDVQEGAAPVAAFVQDLKITFPVLLDQQGRVTSQYRVRGLPTSLFIDRKGVIRVVHLGPVDRRQIDRYLAQIGISAP